jgi:hypothetical protein
VWQWFAAAGFSSSIGKVAGGGLRGKGFFFSMREKTHIQRFSSRLSRAMRRGLRYPENEMLIRLSTVLPLDGITVKLYDTVKLYNTVIPENLNP